MPTSRYSQRHSMHVYSKVECDVPHHTFEGDLAYLMTLSPSGRNRFVNIHSLSYLRLLCEQTEMFETFLRQPPAIGQSQNTLRMFIIDYCKGKDEHNESRRQAQNTHARTSIDPPNDKH